MNSLAVSVGLVIVVVIVAVVVLGLGRMAWEVARGDRELESGGSMGSLQMAGNGSTAALFGRKVAPGEVLPDTAGSRLRRVRAERKLDRGAIFSLGSPREI